MKPIDVRPERPEDAQAVAVVNLSAFGGEDEAKLVEALRATPAYLPEFSLVAELNGRIVGHIMLTRATIRNGDGERELLVLAPLAVVPSQSHRGIGSRLVEEAVRRAGEAGYGAIIEAGKPEFHLRNGFRPAAEYRLECNLPQVACEALTVSELQPGFLAGGGKVFYPAPFQECFGQ